MLYSRTYHESIGSKNFVRLRFYQIISWIRRKYVGIIREESLRFIANLWDGITQAFADIIIIIIMIIAVIAVCMISKHCDED